MRALGLGVGLVALVAVACAAPTTAPPPPPPPADGELALVRAVSWPGGGQELTLRIARDQPPTSAQIAAGLALRDDGTGELLASSVAPVALAPGVLAVLVRPADSADERAAQAAAIAAFGEARPAGERLALFRWGSQVTQAAAFTADRARLARAAASLAALAPDADPLPLTDAVAVVESATFAVEGDAGNAMRALIVLDAGTASVALGATALPVVFAGDAGDAMLRAAADVDELAATAYYTVGFCAPRQGTTAQLTVADLAGALPIAAAAALPEEQAAPCAADALPGTRAYPDTIDFQLDDAQRAVYDQRVADRSKQPFELSVALGAGAAPIAATAHLRGRGTIDCERKSYSLHLDGPGRVLFPGSRTDEVYLISMCADDRYLEQYTANQIMREVGLFPLAFRYVELRLDGDSRGIYLLLEQPKQELMGDNSGVRSVLRRGFAPPLDTLEVDFSRDDDAPAAVAASESVLADLATVHGDALLELARAHFDLDGYLRLVALMSAYQNGDWVDEVWLTATDSLTAGALTDWYAPMGWDNDDLFALCHYTGRYAFVDEPALTYCAESRLDHLLLADPVIYARYVDILADLLVARLPPARFAEVVAATGAALLPELARPGIAAALDELLDDNPAAIDPAEAARDVQEHLDLLVEQYAARHALLTQRIADYRETTSGSSP